MSRIKALNLLFIIMAVIALFTVSNPVRAADSDIYVENTAADNLTIRWNPVADASGYYLGIGEDYNAAYTDCDSKGRIATTTTYKFTNLTSGKVYSIRLKYFKNNDVSMLYDYGGIQVITVPGIPGGLHQTDWSASRNKASVAWNSVQGATGYEVRYIGDDTVTHRISDTSYSFTIDPDDTYKVSVRSYTETNGIIRYSEYSPQITLFAQPLMKETEDGYDVRISGKKLKLSWNVVDDINGYEIFVSTKKNSGYKKVKTVKDDETASATIRKFNGKKFSPKKKYYIYIVAYKIENSKKMYSSSNYVYIYNKGEVSQARKQK